MAANINLHQPRMEYARAARDDENNNGETTTPDGQSTSPAQSTITAPTEQQGQAAGDGEGNEAGSHEASTPPPPPTETDVPKPSFMRYGMGDTVIMDRPDYARPYAAASNEAASNNKVGNAASTASTSSPLPLPKQPNDPTPKPALADVSEPSNRHEPYLTPGLHIQPEQSPHYTNALAYGHEHGYQDDEIMKLAVLMQNNGDANMGREWLALKPEVLRAAVNAVVRNPDNSFDTSGVFGGAQGYPEVKLPEQRVNIDENGQGYILDQEGNRTPAAIPVTPPPGWVLEIVPAANIYSDNASPEQRYFRRSDETQAELDFPYLPLAMTGYMQVPHGRDSELSIGADGGVIDLSQLKFESYYGLITPIDNYIPIKPARDEVGDALGTVLTVVVIGALTFGIGAAVGLPAITATTSVGGAVLIGAASGAIGGLVSGVVNDNLTFKGVFQSALAGGLFAGVGQLGPVRDLNGLGLDSNGNVTSYALRTLSITGQATLRGALQELIGGKFKDGFTQGIAQGLATEIGRAINGDIAARLERGNITAEEATSLRQLSGYTTAAIRALGNPGDPLHAFAQEFIGQLVGDVAGGTTTAEVRGTVFDDDGNLMPGVVSPNSTPAEQQAQLEARLRQQGYTDDDAARVVRAYFHPDQAISYLDQHDWTPDSSRVMSAAQELLGRFPEMSAADAMSQARMLDAMNMLRDAPNRPSSEPPFVVVDRDGMTHAIDGDLLHGLNDSDLQRLLREHGLTATDANPPGEGEPGDLLAQNRRPVVRVHNGRLMTEAQIFSEELALLRIGNLRDAIRKLPGEENFQGIPTVSGPNYIRGQRDVALYEEYLRSRDSASPLLRPTSAPTSSGYSVLPESYAPIGRVINTSGFNITGRTNAAGFPRESSQYWREYARQFPEDLSPTNLRDARNGVPPVIDAVWVARHPEHARFTGEILQHHHLNQGPYAVPIPQSIHQNWFSTWHPLRGSDIQILRDIYKPKPGGK